MIEIEGLNELIKTLDAIGDGKNISAGLGKACALVERSAKEKAPAETGALRRSITSNVENLTGEVFTPLEYAPYVEYGTGLFAEEGGRKTPWVYQNDKGEMIFTRGQNPQPFMRPALYENQEKIIEILKKEAIND